MTTLSREEAQNIIDGHVSPWVRALGLQIESIEPNRIRVRLPFDKKLVHSGGVVCGQAIMAVIDAATMVAVVNQTGGMGPMATVSQTTNFMRSVAQGDILADVRLLRTGRTLIFGDALLHDGDTTKPYAQASITYAIPRRGT